MQESLFRAEDFYECSKGAIDSKEEGEELENKLRMRQNKGRNPGKLCGPLVIRLLGKLQL